MRYSLDRNDNSIGREVQAHAQAQPLNSNNYLNVFAKYCCAGLWGGTAGFTVGVICNTISMISRFGFDKASEKIQSDPNNIFNGDYTLPFTFISFGGSTLFFNAVRYVFRTDDNIEDRQSGGVSSQLVLIVDGNQSNLSNNSQIPSEIVNNDSQTTVRFVSNISLQNNAGLSQT